AGRPVGRLRAGPGPAPGGRVRPHRGRSGRGGAAGGIGRGEPPDRRPGRPLPAGLAGGAGGGGPLMSHETTDELDRAWQLLEQGDASGARALADRLAPALDGEGQADLLLLRAACSREEGKSAEALDYLKQTIAADPEWVTPELWSAELLMSEERTADALAHAIRALDLADEEEEFLEAVAVKAGI